MSEQRSEVRPEAWGGGLPEDLEEMVPGPELAGLLARVDRSVLDADGLLRLSRARQRLVAHEQAQWMMDLHAVARAVPNDGARPHRRDAAKYPWAETEVAFALRWSYAHAADQLVFCDELVDRLPAVFAALDTGEIDAMKARIFCDTLTRLEEPQARAVVKRVIGKAPTLTSGELRARLRRLVLACDPEAIRKQARRDIKDRRVSAFLNDNHLAAVCGYELAPHRAAAVMERLTAIARAAKAAGDPRKIDQIRADAYLDLLVGEGIATGGPITNGDLGLTDPDSSKPVTDAESQSRPVSAGTDPAAARCDVDAAEVPWPTTPADPDDVRHSIDGADPPWSTPSPAPPAPAAVPGPPATQGPVAPGTPAAGVLAAMPGPAMPGPRRGVVDLQVPLTTLMGLSELPGELDGFGPVIADIARQVAQSSPESTTWRYSVYNRLGELAHHGTTHTRPAPSAQPRPGTRSNPRPRPRPRARSDPDPGRSDASATAKRKPTAAVTAFVRARDRTCVAPGCRRTARQCDLDHTHDWAHGGPTHPENLGTLCRLHHIFKHESGCELLQLSPGVFGWTTPTGRQYVTTPDRPLIA